MPRKGAFPKTFCSICLCRFPERCFHATHGNGVEAKSVRDACGSAAAAHHGGQAGADDARSADDFEDLWSERAHGLQGDAGLGEGRNPEFRWRSQGLADRGDSGTCRGFAGGKEERATTQQGKPAGALLFRVGRGTVFDCPVCDRVLEFPGGDRLGGEAPGFELRACQAPQAGRASC